MHPHVAHRVVTIGNPVPVHPRDVSCRSTEPKVACSNHAGRARKRPSLLDGLFSCMPGMNSVLKQLEVNRCASLGKQENPC